MRNLQIFVENQTGKLWCLDHVECGLNTGEYGAVIVDGVDSVTLELERFFDISLDVTRSRIISDYEPTKFQLVPTRMSDFVQPHKDDVPKLVEAGILCEKIQKKTGFVSQNRTDEA